MCRCSQRAPRRRCVREGVSCDMPPSGAADQPGRRGAVEPIDQFERKQEPGALGPIRGAAPGDLDDGDGVVGCIVIDTPPFAPDSNEGAMVQLRRMRRGHGPRGCTTHSVGSVTVNGPAAMLASGTLLTALSHREIWKARLSVSVFRSLQWNVDGGKGVRNLPASVEARASICA